MIKNIKNNNFYIGSSKNVVERFKKHIYRSKNKKCKEYVYPLQRAIRKYGEESFTLEILETITGDHPVEYFIKREKYFFHKLEPEYNQMEPGFTPVFNPDEEYRQKISKKYSGKGNPFYGRTHSKETRLKLSKIASKRLGSKNSFYGRTHSEETKDKISRAKGIAVIGTKGLEEVHFYSAEDAAKWCRSKGLTKSMSANSAITKVCKGKSRIAYGYSWRYK